MGGSGGIAPHILTEQAGSRGYTSGLYSGGTLTVAVFLSPSGKISGY